MKPTHRPSHGIAGSRPQAGFTLVELMISMVIGLFIVLALLTLLINVNRNNSEMTKTNRVIENGRFAIQLLEADLVHAGYWGGFVPQFDDLTFTDPPTDVPNAVPDPCQAFALWDDQYRTNLIGISVQSYAIPSPVPSPTLPVCASRVVSPQPRTDVLFVRHLDTESCIPGAAGCPAAAALGEPHMQLGRCFNTASPGYSAASYVLGTTTTAFTLNQRNCTSIPAPGTTGTRAEIRKLVSNMYYVRDHAVEPGDAVPTLMRSQFGLQTVGGVPTPQFRPAEALVEGIEGFRVEYGIDNVSDAGTPVNFATKVDWADTTNLTSPRNRGDGSPDGQYRHCTTAGTAPCTAADLVNAVAVKIFVLVRSEHRTPGYVDQKKYCLASACTSAGDFMGPFNDGFKRHLFTQTVRLVNVSARRETP